MCVRSGFYVCKCDNIFIEICIYTYTYNIHTCMCISVRLLRIFSRLN